VIAKVFWGSAAALLFFTLATANAGGYRYGVSDQAFYVPALAKAITPALFPRDSDLLDVQMRVWLGDDIVSAVSRVMPIDLPTLALVMYVAGLALLAGAITFFIRGLGGSWWAVAAGLGLATLRHRIARTGANSLEGYFHPRMIAFALGMWALGFLLRRRGGAAFALIAVAFVVHPTTAVWFGIAAGAAVAWQADRRSLWVVAAAITAISLWLIAAGQRMDADWLAVFADKDYLFPTDWPIWAWALNLSYPLVLGAIWLRRRARGVTTAGETALIVGLLVLMTGFLVSVPLTAGHVALAVQAQVTRVLWVLDGVACAYAAWWLLDDTGARRTATWRVLTVALVVAVAAARGYYVLVLDAGRPLVTWTLPADDWTAAMAFLHTRPANTLVLADPEHAWMYGSSVRVAASRDTVLEQIKDAAMAIYDRPMAMRMGERAQALQGFANFTEAQFVAAGARYDADVLVIEREHRLSLPVLYENARFVIHTLR